MLCLHRPSDKQLQQLKYGIKEKGNDVCHVCLYDVCTT